MKNVGNFVDLNLFPISELLNNIFFPLKSEKSEEDRGGVLRNESFLRRALVAKLLVVRVKNVL